MANPTAAILVTDAVGCLGGTPPTDLDPTRSRATTAFTTGAYCYVKAEYPAGSTKIVQNPYRILFVHYWEISDAGTTKYADKAGVTAISTAAGDATTPQRFIIQNVATGKTYTYHQFSLTDLTGVKALVGTIANDWANPPSVDVVPFEGQL